MNPEEPRLLRRSGSEEEGKKNGLRRNKRLSESR